MDRFEWTIRQDTRLIELFNEDELTLKQIAATLGCTISAVRNRLGRLRDQGLVGRKRPPARGRARGA